jgi:hypothetical protein
MESIRVLFRARHTKKIVGKPCARNGHARFERGIWKRACYAGTAPVTTKVYKDLPNSTEAGFSRKGYMSMIGKSLDPKKRTSIKNWFVMDLKRLHLLARIW